MIEQISDQHFFHGDSKTIIKISTPKNVGEQPVLKNYNSVLFSAWGPDNMEPQERIADIRKCNQVATAIDWKSRAVISGGLAYGYREIDPDTGEEKLVRVMDKKIEEWNRRTAVHRYLRESAYDFYAHWNIFPIMRMNVGKTYIDSIECPNTCFVRLGRQNEKTGKINDAYISANWDKITSIEDPTTLKFEVIDPYLDPSSQLPKLKKTEFIYPVQGPDFDYTFYATPPWDSVRKNGWLKVSTLIPTFKEALLSRQTTIKYHIEVSEWYWKWKNPTWDDFDSKKKKELIEAFIKEMDDKLSGATQAGANIMTFTQNDPVSRQMIPGIKITSVDDKLKDGIYIEDSQEASSHLFSAHSIDGSLSGNIPGKNFGAGSGSDKRVAMNIYLANEKPNMDLLLEPLLFIYNYNNFAKPYEDKGGLQLWFANYWMATQDVSKEPQQQAS